MERSNQSIDPSCQDITGDLATVRLVSQMVYTLSLMNVVYAGQICSNLFVVRIEFLLQIVQKSLHLQQYLFVVRINSGTKA